MKSLGVGIALCFLLVLIMSCVRETTAPSAVGVATGLYGVSRFIDEEAGVVCWVYAGGRAGIGCLPLSQTRLQ